MSVKKLTEPPEQWLHFAGTVETADAGTKSLVIAGEYRVRKVAGHARLVAVDTTKSAVDTVFQVVAGEW